jgi:ketosteroid isomerase-like protein
MDAQGTMRLMCDAMDAYDRADFDRLAEIYAEDAQWRNANPKGPHCHNRDDIFTMFRQRMDSRVRVGFDELRSTPTEVVLTARAADFGAVVSVFSFQGRRIVTVKDYPLWRPPRQRSRAEARRLLSGGGAGGGIAGGPVRVVDREGSQRSSDAALSASRSLSPITVAPELTGRGGRCCQVALRSNSRKKS